MNNLRWMMMLAAAVMVGLIMGQAAREPRDKASLARVASMMQRVAEDLDGYAVDDPVQARQREILAQLDQLIEQMQKQCQSSCQACAGGANNAGAGGGNPLPDSAIVGGPKSGGPLADPVSGVHKMDEVTPEQRKAILQARERGFPAGYEDVLENYYRELARETPAP